MDTGILKKFAQAARRQLMEQVGARLELVLHLDTAEIREKEKAINDLQEQITKTSKGAVIERVAYIWFNRFCALRFMDVNRYTKVGAVSPAEGFSQPEMLQEAKQGHIDEELQVNRQQVFDLLSGKAVSTDPQQEAFRLLLVAVCNSYHSLMPFMFERIADYTELLMPEDLLSQNSILHSVLAALNEENCQDVEVIGWLYQFYISEKKDEVFEGLKKNKKITPENIPAATQLFTPHWIVRYLVENSLGRLWMLNRPQSRLVEQMEYYIKPAEPETDFLKINSPEEIKVCDPACGSGHMLTYAFELLYAIYEESGYGSKEIPDLILTKNLYGIEIDERAGALAAFALTMKARQKYRRFFRKPVQPNICVLQNIHLDETELQGYMDALGRLLFTMDFQTTLRQFEEADNFGSLIRPALTDIKDIDKQIEAKGIEGKLHLYLPHQKVLQVLMQADYLRPKYHVVIANPPYMGGKGMNGRLAAWLKDNYTDVKSDLFSAFVGRCSEIAVPSGYVGIMSPNVWMYLSSYEKMRNLLVEQKTLTNLVELPLTGFKGATVQICAYNFENQFSRDRKGGYIRLVNFKGGDQEMAAYTIEAIRNTDCGWFFRSSADDFKKIPGKPIAYWVSEKVRRIFSECIVLKSVGDTRQGMATSDNNRFVRCWHEVSMQKACLSAQTHLEAEKSGKKWFSFNKGGEFRKWYGNAEYFVNWEYGGRELLDYAASLYGSPTRTIKSISEYFKPSIGWSKISSADMAMRYYPPGFIFSDAGCAIFTENDDNLLFLLGFSNTLMVKYFLSCISPTLNFEAGHIAQLPILVNRTKIDVKNIIQRLIAISKVDWDFSETSWDFTVLPLLVSVSKQPNIKATYNQLRTYWQEMISEVQSLEEENNCTFIDAYGLRDELTPIAAKNKITLTCNPHHRYGGEKSEEELEAMLLADTMREFISYAVGCMFGRYALDKPGLILANQGETIDDYLKQIPTPTFPADDDNVIPILDDDWFLDDIASRFRKFLKLTFGEEQSEENLKFIEDALGKDIRKYFLKEFYDDHVRRYKKRPIYWLFSSPKGSFNALIYMHRYRPDTVSIVLNDYLREFRTKLIARREHLETVSISSSASQAERTKALKDIEKLKKTIDELNAYERDILYPLATRKIEIDLDDGVKVNYLKFGAALKKITGLDA